VHTNAHPITAQQHQCRTRHCTARVRTLHSNCACIEPQPWHKQDIPAAAAGGPSGTCCQAVSCLAGRQSCHTIPTPYVHSSYNQYRHPHTSQPTTQSAPQPNAYLLLSWQHNLLPVKPWSNSSQTCLVLPASNPWTAAKPTTTPAWQATNLQAHSIPPPHSKPHSNSALPRPFSVDLFATWLTGGGTSEPQADNSSHNPR
jgi:hypothetical protein